MGLFMEIEAAKTEYDESMQRLNNAEPAFLESAQLGVESAKLKLNELLKAAKEDNVIPFPMVRCEPPEEESNWPERLFNPMEWPLVIAAGILVLAVIVVQFGIWLGWWQR